ncbi:hypothetical protein CC78DRAFT_142554 [Lojkania enalia]|uniref:Uncharacterized protein n=1 Tax=Lojkania enalia TaxID=147567 RepID=A0A9P4NCZ5_9PLEO|nr:hypothetical protein CC78DRAFT_142554 [Didymosphaeria enalia]
MALNAMMDPDTQENFELLSLGTSRNSSLLKRKRADQCLYESGIDCSRSLTKKSSIVLFNSNPFTKSIKQRSSEKMPVRNDTNQLYLLEQYSPNNNHLSLESRSISPTRPGISRRRSTLNSLFVGVKDFFTSTRRKGSGADEEITTAAPTFDFDTHVSELRPGVQKAQTFSEAMHFGSSLASFAHDGMMRFERSSIDQLDTNAGPSTYWREERYMNRQCSIKRDSPCYDTTLSRAPTPQTNADAGVIDDPYRWTGLSGRSPRPTRRRTKSLGDKLKEYSFANGLGKFTSAFSPRASRHPSRSPNHEGHGPASLRPETPIFPLPSSWPLEPAPDIQLQSFSELGVLPATNDSGTESGEVPHAIYSHSSRSSSMIPLNSPQGGREKPSPGSSTRALGPISQYSVSPSLHSVEPGPSSSSSNPTAPAITTTLASSHLPESSFYIHSSISQPQILRSITPPIPHARSQPNLHATHLTIIIPSNTSTPPEQIFPQLSPTHPNSLSLTTHLQPPPQNTRRSSTSPSPATSSIVFDPRHPAPCPDGRDTSLELRRMSDLTLALPNYDVGDATANAGRDGGQGLCEEDCCQQRGRTRVRGYGWRRW